MRHNKVLAVLEAILSTCFVCATLASAQQGSTATTKTPEDQKFSYSGDNGPGFWADINKPHWEACGNQAQSPVDIPGDAEVDQTLTLILQLNQTSVMMFNDDGHTIKVDYKTSYTPAGSGGTITFNDVPYDIQQFHFHTLSEHTFQGHRGQMELHAVFKAQNGNYLAIAMLYEIGNADPFLSTLISAGLPEKSHSKHVPIPALDLADAFTDTSSYYTYAGSLTIPSCFPVTFIVLKTEATMSEEQFLAFQRIMGDNFRPIQTLNGREVRVTPSN
jgi:carbonic anhydrase